MTTAPTVTRTITLARMHAEARTRFGDDTTRWAYQCPVCGHIATLADVRLALALDTVAHGPHSMTAAQVLGQNCIACPADAKDHGTTVVRLEDGREARVFELAPKETP